MGDDTADLLAFRELLALVASGHRICLDLAPGRAVLSVHRDGQVAPCAHRAPTLAAAVAAAVNSPKEQEGRTDVSGK